MNDDELYVWKAPGFTSEPDCHAAIQLQAAVAVINGRFKRENITIIRLTAEQVDAWRRRLYAAFVKQRELNKETQQDDIA